MPLLRYVIALVLRGVMGMVGIGVIAYCGFTIFMSYQAIGNATAAGEGPPPLFLVTHFGFYGLLALGGVGLVIAAVRGIARRIRDGLPSDDEGIGKSPLTLLINILIYGAGFCFGAYSIAVSIVPAVQMSLLVADGITTEATITGFTPTDDPKYWIVNYRFRTADGRVIEDSTFEDGYEQPTTRIMSKFRVTYIAADPSKHDVTEYFEPSQMVLSMVVRFGIALVGLWGLVRNIGPLLPKRLPPVEPMAPPPSQPRMVSATGARAGFGRRGA
jgi:hypothetical protein